MAQEMLAYLNIYKTHAYLTPLIEYTCIFVDRHLGAYLSRGTEFERLCLTDKTNNIKGSSFNFAALLSIDNHEVHYKDTNIQASVDSSLSDRCTYHRRERTMTERNNIGRSRNTGWLKSAILKRRLVICYCQQTPGFHYGWCCTVIRPESLYAGAGRQNWGTNPAEAGVTEKCFAEQVSLKPHSSVLVSCVAAENCSVYSPSPGVLRLISAQVLRK